MHQHIGLQPLLLNKLISLLKAVGHFLVLVVLQLEGELLEPLGVFETEIYCGKDPVDVAVLELVDAVGEVVAADPDAADGALAGDDLLAFVVFWTSPEHFCK